ncbi:unnamed protein product [Kuraishia capsulata CBS 1993]|uniref:DM2 domain-containing protein n=1 Tax=Kuraishia capsulata CBS 1993 TaxID=1382522 RepID=W6MHY1_9ASCO|nr:uncharacterized protein KUCA_T00001631001 [Kuraishia capsulata CBS 1993]CDK25661.1 unnamed protein product [Kuraishia capsulata CBS 1993]
MAKYDVSQLTPTIDAIIRVSDMNVLSMRRLRLVLSAIVNTNLSGEKDELHKLVLERIQLMQQQEKKQKSKVDRNSEKFKRELDKENLIMAQRLNPGWGKKGLVGHVKKRAKPDANKNRGAKKLYKLHPILAEFMNKDVSDRFEITKEVWRYIKDKNLQNPANRREIIADSKLAKVFKERFDMFFIAKKMGDYLIPLEEDGERVSDEDEQEEAIDEDDDDDEDQDQEEEEEEEEDENFGEHIAEQIEADMKNPTGEAIVKSEFK